MTAGQFATLERHERQIDIRRFLKPSVWQSSKAVALTWIGVIGLLWLCKTVDNVFLALPAVLVMAGLQHRLFTIYHEAFHGILFDNRRANDFVGRWLGSYPSLVTFEASRARHLSHHAFAATDDDPERVSHIRNWADMSMLMFPWFSLFGSVVSRLIGGQSASAAAVVVPEGRKNWDSARISKTGEIMQVLALQFVMFIGLLYCFHLWGLLYHFCLLCVTPIFTQIRQWIEHYNGDMPDRDPRFVIIEPNRVERFLMSPMNFNEHAAHHLYPRVPFHNLPAVGQLLEQHGIDVVRRTGYLELFLTEIKKWTS